MRLLLIVNEHARRGGEPLADALDVFARAGCTVQIEKARRGMEVPSIIGESPNDFDAVVLAGGDGTIHDAAPALLEAGLPIGIIPRGTANDLARTLGISFDLKEAAEIIVAGKTRPVDLGEVNGTFFFNVAHIGLGAALAGSVTSSMKRRFGAFAYVMGSARVLRRLTPFRVEIVTPDERLVLRTFGLTVGNGRYFGGSGLVAEDAAIDDGLLHVFVLTTKNPLRLLLLLPSLLRGRHGNGGMIRRLVAPALEVHTLRSMPIRTDGVSVSETPAVFGVRRAALRMFAPASASQPGI